MESRFSSFLFCSYICFLEYCVNKIFGVILPFFGDTVGDWNMQTETELFVVSRPVTIFLKVTSLCLNINL